MIVRGNIRQESARVRYTGRRRSHEVIRRSRFREQRERDFIRDTETVSYIHEKQSHKTRRNTIQAENNACRHNRDNTSEAERADANEADMAESWTFGVVARAA